jgi:transcriptional regulator GlxA family with amidase domain
MRIEIVVFEGFDEVDAVAPYEVLRNAADAVPDLEVELVGASGAGEVVASHGMRVLVGSGLTGTADLVLVPGGGWMDGSTAGARAECDRGELPRRVRELHEQGAAVASVCTGGMLLAAAGLTDGRPATTHHGAIEDLRASGAEVVDARVVDDGDLLTAGGVTSGLDLALHIVEREWGRALADTIAREMEHERQGRVWQRHG